VLHSEVNTHPSAFAHNQSLFLSKNTKSGTQR